MTNKELADHIFITTPPSRERDQIMYALYAADALEKSRDAVAALTTLAEASREIMELIKLADDLSNIVSELSYLLYSGRLRNAINSLDTESLI